jgi:hypothetical protein
MEIIVIISLLMLLAVGVWFIIPNSQKKGTNCIICEYNELS